MFLVSSFTKVWGGWGRGRASLLDDAEDVVLAQDQAVLTVDLDLGAAVLAEENAVADLHVELAHGTVLQDLAVADAEHFALDRLLLGAVRDDDSALGLLLLFHA